ncbi:MAG: MATE family efflux transporter [Clostridia bacterium]|nr:MATE family efflux transporter [Clostridia bacterium]MBR6753671.1 MATE family efflux transporter [Clostridia bacterium]
MQQAKKTMVQDLTGGSVAKLLLKFAFPLFVSNALQAVYNIVDMVVIGQKMGKVGMSAVSTGGDVLHLLTFVAMGFSSAGQVIIARQVGAGQMDKVKKTIGTMFTFLLSIALFMSVGCYFIRDWMLDTLNTPIESYGYTMDYTVTCIVGLVFIYGYNIVSAILRGMGDSKRPFMFVAVAAVMNIILDIVFVFFMGMEVFGAALATVISQAFSFLIAMVYLYRSRESFGFDFKPESFRMDRETLKPLVSLGIPMAIQSAAINISKIVLMAWINAEGVVYSALAGVYNKVGMMSGIVSNSFTTAGASMVGQNLGAKKYKRVPQIMSVVFICGMIISTVFTLVIWLFPDGVFSIFTTEADVLEKAAILIVPTIINFFGCATRAVAFSLINGSGNTKLNFAIAIIDGMISRVGIAALLGFGLKMGCEGFWFGDALAGWMPFVIGMTYFFSGYWKKEKKQ